MRNKATFVATKRLIPNVVVAETLIFVRKQSLLILSVGKCNLTKLLLPKLYFIPCQKYFSLWQKVSSEKINLFHSKRVFGSCKHLPSYKYPSNVISSKENLCMLYFYHVFLFAKGLKLLFKFILSQDKTIPLNTFKDVP